MIGSLPIVTKSMMKMLISIKPILIVFLTIIQYRTQYKYSAKYLEMIFRAMLQWRAVSA